MNYGNKAEGLLKLQENGFRVPAFRMLDRDFFEDYLRSIGVYEETEMVSVKSAWLMRVFESIRNAILKHEIPAVIGNRIKDTVQGLSFPISVRSSASVEDGERQSSAGAFHTELQVEPDGVMDAVRYVICSLYNEKNLLSFPNQDFHPNRYFMGIVLQEMVEPEWSGVAFSSDPATGDPGTVWVEAVEGLGDRLVSGLSKANSYLLPREGAVKAEKASLKEMLEQVREQAVKAEKAFGHPVDIEWSWKDNRIYLLQCRPITTIQPKPMIDRPEVFSMSGLNEETYPRLGFLQRRYPRWAKKAKFFDFCEQSGIKTNKWKLFVFNKDHLKDFDYSWVFHDYDSPYVCYHLNGQSVCYHHIGQIPKVLEHFTDIYSDQQYCVSFREYLPNEHAAISNLNEDGTMLIECITGKMFLLNAGLTEPTRYLLDADGYVLESYVSEQEQYVFDESRIDSIPAGKKERVELPPELIREIYEKTKRFADRFENCSVEWWIWGNTLYAADMSLLKTGGSRNSSVVISQGKAEGTLRRLPVFEDQVLKELNMFSSISVGDSEFDCTKVNRLREIKELLEGWSEEGDIILYADLPFLFLAPFKHMVKGIVFRNASNLCHLSLILREAGVPAISLGGSSLALQDGMKVQVDAYEGVLVS
ncbi:PEP/pyruvate-binding domain-containing protein [Paenibacillus wynnii]|uniref:Phosphoenolpyruvate synthase n=1 Tax=Paenibacillus wynnii TaxID=268407 RepID=A0A098MCJ6_9BACL|nr:PEP/pyruvate-binding domain-containing protein [Paenibacillus wynnii]KGE19751.1 hypothetical protein PWYN_10670 [Paenibacillus wynnii]